MSNVVKLRDLTPKQEAFCLAYAETGVASDAYRAAYGAANMKPTVVKQKAYELLKHEGVQARLAELQERVRKIAEEKFDVTIGRVLEEWSAIAFADPKSFLDWGTRKVKRHTKEGQEYEVEEQFVRIKDQADLTPAQRRVVVQAEMTISKTGEPVASIKLGDKVRALVEIGKHIGFYEVDNAQKGASVGYILKEDDSV